MNDISNKKAQPGGENTETEKCIIIIIIGRRAGCIFPETLN